jgi:hypothetical protein
MMMTKTPNGTGIGQTPLLTNGKGCSQPDPSENLRATVLNRVQGNANDAQHALDNSSNEYAKPSDAITNQVMNPLHNSDQTSKNTKTGLTRGNQADDAPSVAMNIKVPDEAMSDSSQDEARSNSRDLQSTTFAKVKQGSQV